MSREGYGRWKILGSTVGNRWTKKSVKVRANRVRDPQKRAMTRAVCFFRARQEGREGASLWQKTGACSYVMIYYTSGRSQIVLQAMRRVGGGRP